ncbi:hypothetical protein LDO32_08430 [Luteimonas sp. Y-2-2-4F]|nr:hypothetical protein [Luteimonas sp. Y-2-2-4F]MCD9031749.1 hypothetical protein [Luteimonas sp. Y-2-2-4F]
MSESEQSHGDAAAIAEEAEKNSVSAQPDDELINDDERKQFYWKSRWPPDAVRQIYFEATYVVGIFVASLVGILLTWRGDIFWLAGCEQCNPSTLRRYAYLFFSGVMGGSLFGLKYLYKVVARGWWNVDRRLWRLFSPWLAGGIAFGFGALAAAGLFGFTMGAAPGGASFVSLGFIAGYFADSASRKMQEIANTLFGLPTHPPQKRNVADGVS